MNRTNPNRLVIIVFLAMLAVPALLQIMVEVRRGQWPRALKILTQRPAPENLRAYEKDLQETSVTARALRPGMQAALFFALREAGEKALVGRDGWLFYQPGVSFLTQRPRPRDSTVGEAVAAVVHFRDALAARGIRLILMPTPNKESIYPEKLSCFAAPPIGILSGETRAFVAQCGAAGVEVVDLFALYRHARENSPAPLYLAQDSHWASEGMSLAASAVAERIHWNGGANFDRQPASVRRHGDLVLMLQSRQIERRIPPETIACAQVVRRNSNELYADDPAAEVLVLGDSFLRIYQLDEPGQAGFVAHLALALGRPLASIINDGGASTLVRQELFRRPRLLAHTKVVVWEFVERDLRLGIEGWQIVPLPPVAFSAPGQETRPTTADCRPRALTRRSLPSIPGAG